MEFYTLATPWGYMWILPFNLMSIVLWYFLNIAYILLKQLAWLTQNVVLAAFLLAFISLVLIYQLTIEEIISIHR